MTTATAPASLFTLPSTEPAREPAPRPAEGSRPARVHRLAHGRLTLDELVSGAWAAVAAGAPAACPVCDGTLRYGSCADCGAELS